MRARRSNRGSSPRGRGKQRIRPVGTAPPGLIPARAGKTSSRDCMMPGSAAHPRAGGENRIRRGRHAAHLGSSPRGRGKLTCGYAQDVIRRLIPARAGKTAAPPSMAMSAGAHPRAGGENFECRNQIGDSAGSSPRGRGKRKTELVAQDASGLIPARAGKTTAAARATQSGAAHPRAGGENHGGTFRCGLVNGSSPRGRGKRAAAPVTHHERGLIPARAGKTMHNYAYLPIFKAHPRAGGENSYEASVTFPRPGSSPRGRGKPTDTIGDEMHIRLIPARAGKTPSSPTRPTGSAAHPRAGGENAARIDVTDIPAGSSPRGRGKLELATL